MQTISIISLKGGVAKTTTAVNMAYTLAAVHNKKVLIIDNDKQGNTSKAFKKYDTEDKNTVARMMLERNIDVSEIIKKTDYENIDIITANMDLLEANLRTIVDTGRQQQTRFKKALSNSKVLDHGWAKFDYLPLTEAWKAILQDGSLVAPGTNGTLKFDYTGNPANATSGFHITTTVEHKQTDDGAGYGAKDFGTLTAKSDVTIPDILKALALFPNTDKTGRGFIYFRNNGERLLFRGGYYGHGGNAGEALGNFTRPRSFSSVSVGLFSAYVDPALYA